MFYSHSLISKKGPLGTIWMAAYFCKKLKKEQIAKTNIASSVDEIIPDARISYRMLAQLLIGIVRIFSKKVDYLYHECNETLLRISRTFVSSSRYASESTACAPHYKGNTGKPVHGRGAVAVHADDAARKVPQVSSLEKSMLAPHHNFSITIPESFRLDAFDLGIEDQGDHLDTNQQLMLEGEELCDFRYTSSEPRYQGVTSDLFFDVARFTPAGDVASHEILDVNFKNHELNVTSTPEPSEDIPCDLAPLEGSKALSRARKSLTLDVQFSHIDESQHHVDTMEVQQSELPDVGAAPGMGQEKPRTPDRTQDNSTVQLAAGEFDHCVDMMEVQQSEHPNTEAAQVEGQEKPRTPDRTQDEVERHAVTMEVQQSDYPDTEASPKEGQEKPRTPDRTQDISTVQLAAASPVFTVTTPAKMERRKFSGKRKFSRRRKCLFDEDIVLSNETLREMIHDASNLVSKRRKVPHTCLDFWKAGKFSDIQKAFTEPLIPYKMLEIKDLSMKRALQITPNTKSLHQEHVGGLEVSMEHQSPDVGMHEAPPADITVSGGFVGSQDSSKSGDRREKGFIAQEAQDLELNLEDQELSSMEEGTSYQDGLSSRTRSVGQLFCKCLKNQKERGLGEELNLTKILERRKRRTCARLFYETLVLKTHDLVDVRQVAPYADISVLATLSLSERCGVNC